MTGDEGALLSSLTRAAASPVVDEPPVALLRERLA